MVSEHFWEQNIWRNEATPLIQSDKSTCHIVSFSFIHCIKNYTIHSSKFLCSESTNTSIFPLHGEYLNKGLHFPPRCSIFLEKFLNFRTENDFAWIFFVIITTKLNVSIVIVYQFFEISMIFLIHIMHWRNKLSNSFLFLVLSFFHKL